MKLQKDYILAGNKIDEEYIEELRAGLLRLLNNGWKIEELRNHCHLSAFTLRRFAEGKHEPQTATIKAIEGILKHCKVESEMEE